MFRQPADVTVLTVAHAIYTLRTITQLVFNNFHFSFPLFYHYGPGKRSRHGDLLWAGRSGDRIPVGTRFSAPVQTGPGAYPASYTVGTVSFPGVKQSGCGVDRPPLSRAKFKERVEL
jgi:hypothetical protein